MFVFCFCFCFCFVFQQDCKKKATQATDLKKSLRNIADSLPSIPSAGGKTRNLDWEGQSTSL